MELTLVPCRYRDSWGSLKSYESKYSPEQGLLHVSFRVVRNIHPRCLYWPVLQTRNETTQGPRGDPFLWMKYVPSRKRLHIPANGKGENQRLKSVLEGDMLVSMRV